MPGYNELIQVQQRQILVIVHRPVQTVVQSSEQTLSTYLPLRYHIEVVPGQQRHQTLRLVILERAASLAAQRVVVQRHVARAQDPVKLDELDQLQHLCRHGFAVKFVVESWEDDVLLKRPGHPDTPACGCERAL